MQKIYARVGTRGGWKPGVLSVEGDRLRFDCEQPLTRNTTLHFLPVDADVGDIAIDILSQLPVMKLLEKPELLRLARMLVAAQQKRS